MGNDPKFRHPSDVFLYPLDVLPTAPAAKLTTYTPKFQAIEFYLQFLWSGSVLVAVFFEHIFFRESNQPQIAKYTSRLKQ